MDIKRERKILDIVERALALPESGRADFLNRICQGDDVFRGEIEACLTAERQGRLGQPVILLEGTATGERPALTRVGPYSVKRELGRGGMGVVYLGTRTDGAYEKEVAIKVLKRGMDTDQILQRFLHERQILANLEHPNIARLHDGGTTEDGLPYFVMEYVNGNRIDHYCDARRFSIESRLTMFLKVCTAVSFAHQNLVVHCDIKPNNILVTHNGEPKLLDFRVAINHHSSPCHNFALYSLN